MDSIKEKTRGPFNLYGNKILGESVGNRVPVDFKIEFHQKKKIRT